MKFNKYIRIREVAALTGLTQSTVYRLMAGDAFPARHRLGPNSVGWLFDDVQLWIATRPIIKF